MEQEQTNSVTEGELEMETEPGVPAEAADDILGEQPEGSGELATDLTEELRRNWGRDRDVSLEELEGLPTFEQFLKIWATPERGKIIWDVWHRTQNPVGRVALDAMAANTAEEYGISEEEARTRLAVEKFISDRGANIAAKYVSNYKARKLRLSRTLKPMLPLRKRKR